MTAGMDPATYAEARELAARIVEMTGTAPAFALGAASQLMGEGWHRPSPADEVPNPAQDIPARPASAGELTAPDLAEAKVMASVLIHFISSDQARLQLFVAWLNTCPVHGPTGEGHDLRAAAWYLAETHARLEPGCAFPARADIRQGMCQEAHAPAEGEPR